MRVFNFLSFAAILGLFASPVFAESPDAGRFALGIGVGTNGGVIEASASVNRLVVLRAQGSAIDFIEGFNSGDIHYTGRLRFNQGGAFLDLHPFGNPLLISGGGVAGERKVNLNARPTLNGSITIGGITYTSSQVGEVNGTIDYGGVAPFAGLGWDNTFYTQHKIGFRAIAGVVFGRGPNVNLAAVGPLATNSAVLAGLVTEQSSLQHDARDYRYYPIVQLGVNYRF